MSRPRARLAPGVTAIDLSPGGDLYVARAGDGGKVFRYDGGSGMPIGEVAGFDAGQIPADLRFGPDGNLNRTGPLDLLHAPRDTAAHP